MRFAYDWLKRHLDTEKSVYEIADELTSLGIEVDEVIDNYDYLKNFSVATVKELRPHPDSDHLKICTVDTGDGIVTIVTGASNVKKGKKYPLAKIGTFIPNGEYTIELRKLRGIESNGMLCSADEMLIPGEYEDGLMELSDKLKNGTTIYDALNLHEYILDVSITPNRGDCFGIRGIAKDLAAKGVGILKDLKIPSIKTETKFPYTISSDEFVSSTCQAFTAIAIRNIHNAESPSWLQKLLISAGLKPKNVIVDVTNFMSIDMARPLHAYDINLIDGHNLTVKYSNNGTEFTDLKGNKHILNDTIAVLADELSPISILGIMGGERTMCSLNTTDIILESVYLTPEKIMAEGQYLNITSDARTRFERGTDPETVVLCLKIAADMIVNICGGEVSEIVSTSSYKPIPNAIPFKISDFEKLMGITFEDDEVISILQNLGFDITETEPGKYTAIPPSARHDIHQKEDLIEEVARVFNYDKFKENAFFVEPLVLNNSDDEVKFKLLNSVKKFLASNGYDETVNYSFISKSDKERFFRNDKLIELANPLSVEFLYMRPSLLSNMVNLTAKLLNYGEREVNIFEVGNVYSKNAENTRISAVAAFPDQIHNPWNDKNKYGIFDIKRVFFSVLSCIGIDLRLIQIRSNDVPSYMHITRTGIISVRGIDLGFFGEVNPKILSDLGIRTRVVVFDFDFDKFFNNRDVLTLSNKKFANTKLQKIYRDFAFVFDKGTEVQKIKGVICTDHRISNVITFDVYEDEVLGNDKISIAFNIEIDQADGKTLTDDDIQEISSKIIKSVGMMGGVLRG